MSRRNVWWYFYAVTGKEKLEDKSNQPKEEEKEEDQEQDERKNT